MDERSRLELICRAQVKEILNFLHEVNGDKFIQSVDEIAQRLDCIVSVSF